MNLNGSGGGGGGGGRAENLKFISVLRLGNCHIFER
jgi:hypothetical protein